MRELAVLTVIGLGTYAMRAVFIVSDRAVPAALTRLLPHVGPSVLAAITLPALLAPRGTVTLAETLPALLAAAAAVLLWRLWRRNGRLPVALFGGLGVWWAAGLMAVSTA
jgi:branched-subunit amino acid transport protein